MNQNWIVVDLDERVCLHGGGKLGEWFWSNPSSVIDALSIPDTHKRIDSLIAGRTAVQRSPFLRLPFDIIDDIFIHIASTSGAQDSRVLLLALTCKRLLTCARRHIVRLQLRQYAPLAGHRLICIGDHAQTLEDYPSGLLTPAEVTVLQGSTARQDSRPDTVPGSDNTAGSTSLYAHATARWWRYSYKRPCLLGCVGLGATITGMKKPMGSAALMDLLYRPSAVSRMSKEDFALFQMLTAPYRMEPGSARDTWVLCNTSKNEYVRADGCAEVGGGKLGVSETVPAALWHMLLARICWSPSDNTGMGYKGEAELHRGRWAGDRFAVTTLDRMVQIEDGMVWKDVTVEVTRLVEDLRVNADVPAHGEAMANVER